MDPNDNFTSFFNLLNQPPSSTQQPTTPSDNRNAQPPPSRPSAIPTPQYFIPPFQTPNAPQYPFFPYNQHFSGGALPIPFPFQPQSSTPNPADFQQMFPAYTQPMGGFVPPPFQIPPQPAEGSVGGTPLTPGSQLSAPDGVGAINLDSDDTPAVTERRPTQWQIEEDKMLISG